MKLQPQLSIKHVLSQMLHRSLEILQLTQIELSALIMDEVEKNPLLELESNSRLEPFVDYQPSTVDSIHGSLLQQMREAFPDDEKTRSIFLEELDEKGFLFLSTSELASKMGKSIDKVEENLRIVKTFDPPGLFANNLQECFLLQLEREGKQKTVAFQIIQFGFPDFLAGRYSKLKKTLRISSTQLQAATQLISHLKTRPLDNRHLEPIRVNYPDLRFEKCDGKWLITLLDDSLPKFRISDRYHHLFSIPEHKQTLRPFMATAKWLSRSILRRKELLVSIGKYLVKKQSEFFEGTGAPIRLTSKDLAHEFSVHESTIFRAIANKTIETPDGLIPMRILVSSPCNGCAKGLLARLVGQENALEPYTDDKLASQLQKAGHKVARRTIAKYRKELKIRPSSARKHLK